MTVKEKWTHSKVISVLAFEFNVEFVQKEMFGGVKLLLNGLHYICLEFKVLKDVLKTSRLNQIMLECDFCMESFH